MGLRPLEFDECLLDSPYFRDNLYEHEKELDETNNDIKKLIRECKNLLTALEALTNAQSKFADMLQKFRLRYVGETDPDDDFEYEDSFPHFASIIERVEEERMRMLHHAQNQLIDPLERFRKEQIGKAKEEKKVFDKATEKICGILETHTKINPKKKDGKEADAQLEHELRNFRDTSLAYVSKLHEVNEKKKFEFVEIMLAFVYGQATFFHNGHDVFCDSRSYLTELQLKLQRTRENFDTMRQEAEELKIKTTRRFNTGELHKGSHSRQGYLFVHEKKKSAFTQSWLKHYCSYTKENKILTMQPYIQTQGKLNSNTDTLLIESCIRKANEGSDRRFLFDIHSSDRTLTLQSLTEEDRKQWLEVMEGKEPIYMESVELALQNEGITVINDTGLEFARKCMEAIEKRGLDDQGLYRIAGVSSKFNRLLQTGIDPKQLEKLDLISEESPWEIKTITSAMKQYFRNLSDPLLTFKHHHDFLSAIKLDTHAKKIARLQELLQILPDRHYVILKRLMHHLKQVSAHSDNNLMQASNLGVVLGPTLMRPKLETMAAIMNIKYQSIVVENIIDNYDSLFLDSFRPEANGKQFISGNETSSLSSLSSYERTDSTSSNASADLLSSPPMSHAAAVVREKASKYKAPSAPPPPRPGIPKAKIDYDPPNSFPMTHIPKSSSNGSIKSSTSYEGRPGRPAPPAAPLPKPEKTIRFAETVGTFTAPTATPVPNVDISDSGKIQGANDGLYLQKYEVMSAEGLSRRLSYQLALDENKVKSTDIAERGPAPAVKAKPRNSVKGPPVMPKRKEWTVKTLYNCVGENDNELSFEADEIITKVRLSSEEGWLIGVLNGKEGLIPKNYCEKVD